MDDETQQRLGTNEAVFREVNEGIERGQWPGEENEPISFRCECARLGCNQMVELSVHAYENVRSYPRRFVVLPGHERLDVEVVVEARPGDVVVEKVDQAGINAERTDPRT